jgi:tRNA 2-thiocytidine biosynthesis protein TtcA
MLDEKLIARYAREMNFPEIKLGCPTDGASKREEIKKMLQGFYSTNRKIKGNIFHAIRNVKPEYLPQ